MYLAWELYWIGVALWICNDRRGSKQKPKGFYFEQSQSEIICIHIYLFVKIENIQIKVDKK